MDKVILITGATSGMGKATALLLAERGYRVFAGARTAESAALLQQAAAERGVSLATVMLDVCDSASVDGAVDYCVQQAGRVDALINNAGYGLVATVEDGTDAEFTRQFDVNVFGVLRTCRAVLPVMRAQQGGVIINVSSFLSQMGLPLLAHYNASKFAVEGITESLRYEVAPFGIRVNSVLPGLFRTNFVNKGLDTNKATMAEDSPYQPLVSHFVPIVAEKINQGPDCTAVAEAVLAVLDNDDAPIRTPVGVESEQLLPLSRELGPEGFEDYIKTAFGL